MVEECFPTLLEVATAQREHTGGFSPQSWTEAKILTLVCNFLAMDEKFDETSTPRDNSRVLGTVERIITAGKYPDEGPPSDFRLPGWAKMTPTQLIRSLSPNSQYSHPANSTEPPLSRADTLEWVKWKEWGTRKRLESQISDSSFEASLDSMIEAGKNGPSKQVNVKLLHNAAKSSPSTDQEMISFIRGKDGTKRVDRGGDNPRAVLRTYDELCPLLTQVRTIVINANGKISAGKLEQEFKGTPLGRAASNEDYANFIDLFADHTVTAKNVAKVFLSKKLGRDPASVESSISRARKQMNARN